MNHTSSLERTYENAIRIIESRQRQTRPSSVSREKQLEAMPSSGTPGLKGTPGIVGMSEWLGMLGHSADDINGLNIVHVAGTKGKGSTCAFIESFLRAHGERTGFPRKTGLYTSPHLTTPLERIRINSMALTPELFAKYFFEVYDKLPQLSVEYDQSKAVVERGPRSLQLYALLAFHTFLREKVDVAILETHSGGEYDATNVVTQPVVTTVTSLGMDHVQTLGPTIENIAWHKAGIFKSGATALSTVQAPEPAKVLETRATEKEETLTFVDEDPRLPRDAVPLKPRVQKKNASLAIAASEAFLRSKATASGQMLAQEDIRIGVDQWLWPGRFQMIVDKNRTWFVDAAHNEMSVREAAWWFADAGTELNRTANRILIFSHISEHRDATGVLQSLVDALKFCEAYFSRVIFTTFDESESKKGFLRADNTAIFADTWKGFYPDADVYDEPTIGGAIQLARRLSTEQDTQILITGSQHLIGPALRIFKHNHKAAALPDPEP